MGINIGGKLRSLRQKNNLTQKELADRCELSKGFISQLESNQTSPSLSTLEDILTTLGSSFHEFFSDEQGDDPPVVVETIETIVGEAACGVVPGAVAEPAFTG